MTVVAISESGQFAQQDFFPSHPCVGPSSPPQELASISAVLEKFGLDYLDVRPVSYLHYNSEGWRIEQPDGTAIMLKKLVGVRWRRQGFLESQVRLFDALLEGGVDVPMFLKAADGSRCVHHEDRSWAAYPWIDGTYFNGSPTQCGLLGSHLAKLHHILSRYEDAWLSEWCSDPRSISSYGYLPGAAAVLDCLAASERAPEKEIAADIEERARAIIQGEKEFLISAGTFVEGAITELWNDRPHYTHSDLSARNLLFNQSAHFLDFEKISILNPGYDVGMALGTAMYAAAIHYGPGAANQAREEILSSYCESAERSFSPHEVMAFALAQGLHLALLNVQNVFKAGNVRGFDTFRGHLCYVRELMALM